MKELAPAVPTKTAGDAPLRFGPMRSLQKFAAVHVSVTSHFNSESSLTNRPLFNANRAAALAGWRQLGAHKGQPYCHCGERFESV